MYIYLHWNTYLESYFVDISDINVVCNSYILPRCAAADIKC